MGKWINNNTGEHFIDSVNGDCQETPQSCFRKAAVAVVIERIANLDKDAQNDLCILINTIQDCSKPEDLRELTQIIQDLLFPH